MKYLVIVVFLLGGCTVLPENIFTGYSGEEVIARYGPKCEEMGYKKDTDAYRGCAVKLYTE